MENNSYLQKLGITDPLSSLESPDVIDGIKQWPPIDLERFSNIYLIEVKEFINSTNIEKCKEQKAFSYFDSSYVAKIFHFIF